MQTGFLSLKVQSNFIFNDRQICLKLILSLTLWEPGYDIFVPRFRLNSSCPLPYQRPSSSANCAWAVVLKHFEIMYHLMFFKCWSVHTWFQKNIIGSNVLKINIAHKPISNIIITHKRIITQKRINKAFQIWQQSCSHTNMKSLRILLVVHVPQFENHCTRELFKGSNESDLLQDCTRKKFFDWGL